MARLRATALFVVLATFGAGCVSVPDGEHWGAERSDVVPGFLYQCAAGTVERVPGVCVRELVDPAGQLSEPALALHPTDPRVMAVGVHVVGGGALAAGARLVSGRVYVTEDDGATWRASDVPMPPGREALDYFSDPSLAFAPDGTLHASGMAIHPVDGDVQVFATSSADLGRTWTTPVELTDGRNDRNWESVGPDGAVYVSSHVCCGTSKVSWSRDSGRTWERLAETPEGCYTGSPVAFVDGAPWLACAIEEGGGLHIDVLALDRDARLLTRVSRIEGMSCIAPRILQGPDGGIVVTCYGGLVARSDDRGRTWRGPFAIGDFAGVDDRWPGFQVYWSEIDATNVLHLLLATFHRPAFDAYVVGQEHRVAHVALDARTFDLVHEARLTPEAPESRARPPHSAAPPLGDDWWGIAFGPDGRGAMVWTWAGGVDVARFRAE